MEPGSRDALVQRIHQEVHTILTEGDQGMLQGLPRQALLVSIENEIRFLGLYNHSDNETPRMIHAILDEYLDEWRAAYRVQPPTTITIAGSPFIQIAASSSLGIPRSATTHYISFTHGIESTHSLAETRRKGYT
jgi:hypothetical protein